MQIHLNVTKHCIETEMKRQYKRALSEYFRSDEKTQTQLETLIQTLQPALEAWDFGYLRGTYRQLGGGSDSVVVLKKSDGRLDLIIDDVVVETFDQDTL